MLLYRPRFRHAEKAARPVNLVAAEALAPGVTPVYPDPADLVVDIETPSGEVMAVDDPALRRRLGDPESLTLLRSERALTDPYAEKQQPWGTYLVLAVLIGIAIAGWRYGWWARLIG